MEVLLFVERQTIGSKKRNFAKTKTDSLGSYVLKGVIDCGDSVWVRSFRYLRYDASPPIGVKHGQNVVNIIIGT